MEKHYFVPKKQLEGFMKNGSMNHQYGVMAFLQLDMDKAQALLPPPLKVTESTVSGSALGYLYIVNIREPSFGPWYMEGGIGIMAELNGHCGLHFLGLQLSGPGALMGMCSGREISGLPKKICDRIHVERLADEGHCYIERDGVRLLDVQVTMGQYNNTAVAGMFSQNGCSKDNPLTTGGGCLLFKQHIGEGSFDGIDVIYYDSCTRYYQWDPATIKVALASSANDPWGDLPVTGVLGGGWMVSDNYVPSIKTIYTYPQEQVMNTMQYLFSGKFDRSTLYAEHQSYE